LEENKMVECNDKNCAVHGNISVRGNLFTGTVVSAKPSKTAIVERTIVRYVPKYERYKKSKSRITAHNPECINAKEDDVVRIGETRKISKTKTFVVLKIVGKKKIVKSVEDTFTEKEKKGEAGEEKKEKPVKEEEKEEEPVKEEPAEEEKAEEEEKKRVI